MCWFYYHNNRLFVFVFVCVFYSACLPVCLSACLPVCLSACLPVDMITAIGCKEVGCSAKYLVTLQVTNNMIWVNNHLTVGCVSF